MVTNEMTINEILALAEIKTIRSSEINSSGRAVVYLEYNGKRTIRPSVHLIDEWCLEHFGVVLPME